MNYNYQNQDKVRAKMKELEKSPISDYKQEYQEEQKVSSQPTESVRKSKLKEQRQKKSTQTRLDNLSNFRAKNEEKSGQTYKGVDPGKRRKK